MPDQTKTIETMAAEMVAEDIGSMAQTIKNLSGTPYGVHNLSPRNELWAWGYEDDTVDVDGLRASGIPDAEIAARRFPLQAHLMQQAGITQKEQHAYAERVTERWLRARDAGQLPAPPRRPTPGA